MECNTNAPSQAPLPAEPIRPPSTPFEQIFGDFFSFGGHHYLVVGDRLSGWSEVYSTPSGTPQAGAKGLIRCLRSFFATFGVPEEISSDGGPEFVAAATQEFFRNWEINHRVSSAYFPRSNGRAEVAVKSTKRLLRANLGPGGTLNTDKFLRAMLQLRNTPDTDCTVSPAEIVFGRPLRDAFSFSNRIATWLNPAVSSNWRDAWSMKELALRKRFVRWFERHNERTKELRSLKVGDRRFVQNRDGQFPRRWDRTGLVVQVLPHCKYVIKIDGSGRLTNRNRQFLRLLKPATQTFSGDPVPLDFAYRKEQANASRFEDPCDRRRDMPSDREDGAHHRGDGGDRPDREDGAHQRGDRSDRADGAHRGQQTVSVDAGGSCKVPLALRRLRTYIEPGPREQEEAPRTRLRPR